MLNVSACKKITRPTLLPTILHRSSLITALNEALMSTPGSQEENVWQYKLLLLCAPAGYGKTTFLAQFAEDINIPCCWYFLDRTDASPITFFETLSMSIHQCFLHAVPSLSTKLLSILSPVANQSSLSDHVETQVVSLLAALAAEIPGRFALIICNYQEVSHNQEIICLINRIIQHLPSQCILVLESRSIPHLDFTPLLARREILGMGSNELRFTKQEINDLTQLMRVTPFTDAEMTQLEQSFNGWITGIVLGTRFGDLYLPLFESTNDTFWKTPAMRMDEQRLLSYLNNEVFASAPEAYNFLKEGCILQQMTPSLCDKLLGTSDSAKHLKYLEQQGLFVTLKGNGKNIYICHPAIRELLYNELRDHAPTRFVWLHSHAIEVLSNAQDHEQAIYHALQVKEYERVADLITHVHRQMFSEGNCIVLAYWIDALPLEVLRHYSQLLLTRASIFLELGEYAQVETLLEIALAVPKTDAEEVSLLWAKSLIIRGAVRFQKGEYLQAQELCLQALAALPPDEMTLRVEAQLYLSICTGLLNSFTNCIIELQQVLRLLDCHTQTCWTARLHSLLANAYGMIGNYSLSEHHRTYAIRGWEQSHSLAGRIDNLIGLGVTKHRQSLFSEAELLLTDALHMSRTAPFYRRGEAYALVSLGDIYQDQDCYNQALTAFEDGLILARRLKDDYLTSYTLYALATTYLLMGDLEIALLLASETSQEAIDNPSVSKYKVILHKLTLGMILLRQQRYKEAYDQLILAETLSKTAGLRREQVQAAIRAYACLFLQGERTVMKRRMREVMIQARENGYEQVVQLELSRIPEIQHVLQNTQEMIREETSPLQNTDDDKLAASSVSSIMGTVIETNQWSLRVQALGEPCVFLNDVPITRWRMGSVLELFFLLLNAGRPMHKDQIIEALWPESDNDMNQMLRSTSYYLRKVLGAKCVVSCKGTYALDLTAVYRENVWYDVTAFQEHRTRAQAALKAENDPEASQEFQEMIRLYQGNYVQSFYDNWCIPRRNELQYAYLDAHHQLASISFRHKQYEESISHWQQLLSIDNCLEEAHYGLISSYIQQDKRGLALRQYQICARVLHEDLDTEPGQAIKDLYRQILQK